MTRAVLCCSLCYVGSVSAQQYGFLNYTTDNGLAQSQVTGMCQDNYGYLWFSTYGGISRFNGIDYENYTAANGLFNNQVHSIYKDDKGQIYFGGTGGYSVLKSGKLTSVSLKKSFSQSIIVSFISDKNALWILTDDAWLLKAEKNKITEYMIPDSNVTESRNLILDKSKLLISTNNGIFEFDMNSKKFSLCEKFGLNNFSYIVAKNDQYAVSTFGDGIFIYKNNQFKHITVAKGLVEDAVRHLYIDDNGNIWVATISGVSQISPQGQITNYSITNGLPGNNIRFTGQDNEGNIWFGTDGKGIVKFTGRNVMNYTRADGFAADMVMSILEFAPNEYWFATHGEGVVRFKDNKVETFGVADGLANSIVWTLAKTHDNKIWMGTSQGLSVYDGKKFTSYTEKDGLLSGKVTSLYCDANGILWIGTRKGLNSFDGKQFRNYERELGSSVPNIRCIIKDEHGVLWLASSAGLVKFDGKQSEFFKYNPASDDNTIFSLRFDVEKNLWVASHEGLYIFKKGVFKRVTNSRYFDGSINFLLPFPKEMWVGTNTGVYTINLEEYYKADTVIIKTYDKNEGLKGRETNMNSVFLDSRKNIWLGTDGALVKIGRNRQSEQSYFSPFVHITDVKIFFESPDWKKLSKESPNDFGYANNIRVKHSQNHFTFYFTGISHTQPQKLRYKFMLEGFDEDWLPVTELRYITYSNLPAGSYRFKVLAQNAEGHWSKVAATYDFFIIAPFWRTWWFYSLCALMVVFLFILFWQVRLRQLKRKNQTMQLFYKSKLLSLEQQSLNASMNRHFIFNSLNSIQYYINKQDKLEANRYLTNFAKLIRKNLDSSISSDLIPLSEELSRIQLYLSLETMRYKDRFDSVIEIDPQVDPQTVMIPPMLFQPYIENSIWHGILPREERGLITIRITPHDTDNQLIVIEILDDGIGISNSLASKVDTGSTHISRGIEITSGRLALLKKITNQNLEIIGPLDLTDSSGKTTGTSVKLIISVKSPLKGENIADKLYEN